MSLYVSERQFQRENRADVSVPLLLPSPGLTLQYRHFPDEFEYHSLLLDVYEVSNPGKNPASHLLMPTSCTLLAFSVRPGSGKAALIGPQERLRKLLLPPGGIVFFARFRPGSGEWLLREIDMAQAAGCILPPGQHLLTETDSLLAAMRRAESWHERLLMLLRRLEDRHGAEYRPFPLVQRCLAAIYDSRGQVQVQELARSAGCSERYLNIAFASHVGFSVKTVCQITRIHFSLGNILEKQPKSLLETAVDYGYFDQTHMNRFYRKYMGGTANDMRYAEIRRRCAADLDWQL